MTEVSVGDMYLSFLQNPSEVYVGIVLEVAEKFVTMCWHIHFEETRTANDEPRKLEYSAPKHRLHMYDYLGNAYDNHKRTI